MRHALNYRIVLEPIKEKDHKVAGGLQLSQEFDTELRYVKGKLISIGHKVMEEMKEQPIQLAEGDIVFYDRHAGHEIRWTGDKPLKVIKLGDLVAIDKCE